MRMFRLLALSISFALLSGPIKVEAQQRPTEAIYDLVRASDPDTVVGRSSLISGPSGIFLTAAHLLLAGDELRLKKNGKLFEFEVIGRGNNISKVLDDWAILEVSQDQWSGEIAPVGIGLVYVVGDPSSLQDAAILTGSAQASFPKSTTWKQQIPWLACNETSVGLVEASRYDRGDSGSPLYLKHPAGAAAITSRFETGAEQLRPGEKELVEEYYRLTDAPGAAASGMLSDQALREIIKDKILIKMVPTKCALDAYVMAAQSFEFNGVSRLVVAFEVLMDQSKVSDDEQPASNIFALGQKLKETKLDWTEILQLLDKYYSVFDNPFTNSGSLDMWATLSDVVEQANLRGLEGTFLERMKLRGARKQAALVETYRNWAFARDASIDKNRSSLTVQFVNANARWNSSGMTPLQFPRQAQLKVAAPFNQYKLARDLFQKEIADSGFLGATPRSLISDLTLSLVSSIDPDRMGSSYYALILSLVTESGADSEVIRRLSQQLTLRAVMQRAEDQKPQKIDQNVVSFPEPTVPNLQDDTESPEAMIGSGSKVHLPLRGPVPEFRPRW